jgi:hypothetical protein
MKSTKSFSYIISIIILAGMLGALNQIFNPTSKNSDNAIPPSPTATLVPNPSAEITFDTLSGVTYLQALLGDDKNQVLQAAKVQVKQLVNGKHTGNLHVDYASIDPATIPHKYIQSWINKQIPQLNDINDIQYQYVYFSRSSNTYQVPLLDSKNPSKGVFATLILAKSNSGYALTSIYSPY